MDLQHLALSVAIHSLTVSGSDRMSTIECQLPTTNYLIKVLVILMDMRVKIATEPTPNINDRPIGIFII
jgi:hypothetical protein